MKVTRILLIAAIAGTLLTGCKKDDKPDKPEVVKVTGITLNKSATTIVAGESEQLSVTEVKPDNATEQGVTWDSDNKDRATVDETGKVSVPAVATVGTVNITATAKDGSGVTATCVVTVTEPDPRLPYYATWVADWSLTFSANEVRVDLEEGWYKVSPITWTAVTNTNSETKDDFPSGYKITGLVSEEEESSWWGVGDPFGDDWAYFLHKDGNSIIEQGDDNSWWDELKKDIPETKSTVKRLIDGMEQAKMRGSGKRH